jgi:hypothetical protein
LLTPTKVGDHFIPSDSQLSLRRPAINDAGHGIDNKYRQEQILPSGDNQKSTSSRGTSVTNQPCGLQPNTEFPTNSAQFVGHECSDPREGYIFDVLAEEDDEDADDSQPTLHRNKSPVACRNLSPERKVSELYNTQCKTLSL